MQYNNRGLVDSIKKAYCWHKTPELKDTIHAMEKLDYSTDREKIKNLFDQLIQGTGYEPFTSINRFPKQQSWVYIGAPEYIEVLSELKMLLNQNDMIMPGTPLPSSIITLKLNGEDRTQTFNRHLTKLKLLVASNTKVYTRETFEAEYELKWQ
ncbi:hypothetical protein A0J61_02368 [Choanephora cucurbitarum]|uniref:Uncharacterized protein n=1 Tax=Choanephora cucurbitarum TaxID=101091 RepID=A0A1C7NKC4_9FUNG|nr:hypothetical protein A0J61_02368 [Choanephora cucurbitarum]